MSIKEGLKVKTLELRKSRDPFASLLVTVQGEAQALAKKDTKDGVTPDVDDEYTVRAIKKFIKIADENITIYTNGNNAEGLKKAEGEKSVLEALLPKQASEADLTNDAIHFLKHNPPADGNYKKAIGPTMKFLVDKYGASLDKGLASKVIQSLVNDPSKIIG